MQTKRKIWQLLSTAGIRPNKKLGQHFLTDLNLMQLLVDCANVQKDDIVLEVGCGTGSLTETLAQRAGTVVAVEIDHSLAAIAKGQLADCKNVEIINCDVLKSKNSINQTVVGAIETARKKHRGRILLLANLPYNVASPVMADLITGPVTANAMFVTVQKELADRMTAEPGGKNYGILSILLCATGEVEVVRTLKPSVFWPPPQVDSAMISFVRLTNKSNRIKDMQLFTEIVRLFMGHRRKTLKACARLARGKLAKIDWQRVFDLCSITARQRPAQLGPQDYVSITNLCYDHLKR
jgi:16S rRNA (adenine1518-N6/adenine1519-N6)-dimethyltransferase